MPENNKGFEIAVNIRRNILRIRAWGAWDVEFEKKCEMALRDKIIELSTHAQWKIWYVLVDLTRWATQSEAIASMLEKPLITADKQEIKKIAFVCNSPTPQAFFTHARDAPAQACFESTDNAMQWLMK